MSTPRFHPFLRIIIFASGALLATLLVFGVLALTTNLLKDGAPSADVTAIALKGTVLTYPGILLWMWVCRRQADGRSFVSLGLRRNRAGLDCMFGMLAAIGTLTLLFAVLLLTGFIGLGATTGQLWSSDLVEFGATVVGREILVWLAVFVAVGFFEEMVFRGYLFQNLVAWMGVAGATISQAIAFAVVHLPNVAAIEATPSGGAPFTDALNALPGLFLIAVFFVLCYLKTGSLWFPIGFHIAWNFFLGCIFSLPVSGIAVPKLLDVTVHGGSLITGGIFGPEASILLVPILVAMCVLLLRQPTHPQATMDLALLRPPRSAEPELEDEEPHVSRYKTRMGSPTTELEPEVSDSLRQLSEAMAARREAQARPVYPGVTTDVGDLRFTGSGLANPPMPVNTRELEPAEAAANSPEPISATLVGESPTTDQSPGKLAPAEPAEKVPPEAKNQVPEPPVDAEQKAPSPPIVPKKPSAPRW